MENKALVVVKQSSLATENSFKNGIQKTVHIVVKNQPFVVSLGLAGNSAFGESSKIDCRLVYDSESLKEVDFVKKSPMECKIVQTESPAQINVELKMKVLTSQLEDMLFRIRFTVLDSETLRPLTVLTEPIKVVSKPEQAKKNSKKQTLDQPHPSTKKRDLNENLLECLLKVEAAVDQQINSLAVCTEATSANMETQNQVVDGFLEQLDLCDQREKQRNSMFIQVFGKKKAPPSDFQVAMKDFLNAFESVPFEMRAAKIRKASRETPDVENFLTEVQQCLSDSKSPEPSKLSTSGSSLQKTADWAQLLDQPMGFLPSLLE